LNSNSNNQVYGHAGFVDVVVTLLDDHAESLNANGQLAPRQRAEGALRGSRYNILWLHAPPVAGMVPEYWNK
jgi:hypothetical protein